MSAAMVLRDRPAFTLIELVLTTMIMAIVMGSLGSVFVLTARALPDGQPATQSQSAATALIQRFTAELACATSITTAGPTSITFVTPDRTGDGTADTIRYEWNGLTTGSVTRALNGESPGVVLSNVKRFALAYHLQTETVQPAAEPSEVLLASYESTLWGAAQLTNLLWRGALVLPALGADATSYSITRVLLNVRTGTRTDATTGVSIYAVDSSGLPTGSPLASATIPSAVVGATANWQTASFASPASLSAGDAFAFVASGAGSNAGARITTTVGDSSPPRSLALTTTSAGSSWTKGGKDIPNFQIYGKVYGAVITPSTRRFVTRVSVDAQVNVDGSPRLTGGVVLVNQPEMPQ